MTVVTTWAEAGTPAGTRGDGAETGCGEEAKRRRVGRKRVLIVDDDVLVRMVIEAAVETVGDFEVLSAGDGATGVDLIKAFAPDYVFLDLLVPGLNGFGVLAQLREERLAPHAKVIVSSGLMGSETMERLAELGATDFLPKPFSLADLRATLAVAPAMAPVAAG